MQFPSKKYSLINTLLISLFLIMWLYTKITEYNERTAHQIKVDNFMTRGDRFTADDGERLRKLVEGHVQENHKQLEALTDKINELEQD